MISDKETTDLIARGIEAIEDGNTAFGLDCLEKADASEKSPVVRSYLAFCIARERGQFKEAIDICHDAIEEEPTNAVVFLNYGRVYVASGQKEEAIRMFRDGLLFQENPRIRKELDRLGWRDLPVIPALGRTNPLNKFLGILSKKLRLK